MKRKTHEEFMIGISSDVIILDMYTNRRAAMNAECRLCGNKWVAVAQSLGNGSGCPICAPKKRGLEYRKTNEFRYIEVKTLALTYTNRKHFMDNEVSAYRYCIRHGLIQELTGHMVKKKGIWSKDKIAKEALKYTNKCDFQLFSVGAYKASRVKNIFDVVCSHMADRRTSDGDVLYIWNVVGTDIYKIGVTSVRLGETRIKDCAKGGGFEYDIVIIKAIDDAFITERDILSRYGRKADVGTFDGSSEFVHLTPAELKSILQTF